MQLAKVADPPAHEVVCLDDRRRRGHSDVYWELDLELMLLQLKVMHHLLEAMRPTVTRTRMPRSTRR
jgi:hypothetical protein